MFRSNVFHKRVKYSLDSSLRISWNHLRPTRRNTNHTGTVQKDPASLSTPVLSEEEQFPTEVHLQPVPPLTNALFKPTRHQQLLEKRGFGIEAQGHFGRGTDTGRSWVEIHTKGGLDAALRTCTDGRKLLAEAWDSRNATGALTHTSTGFNAIAARLHRLGLEIGTRHILYGMTTVFYPSAMKQYLRMLEISIRDQPLAIEEYGKTFADVARNGLFRTCKPGSGSSRSEADNWGRHLRQKQWFNVITGLRGEQLDQPNGPRDFSLYDLGPGVDLQHWDLYMDLLGVLLGSSAVYHEYLRFKNPGKIRQVSRIPSRRGGITDIEAAKHILNATILAIIKNDLNFAWKSVLEHIDSLQDLYPSTWRALLITDPGYNQTWIPRLSAKLNTPSFRQVEDQVLDQNAPIALENEIGLLETYLGVHWIGGEDGYHMSKESQLRREGEA